ncbi:MAG: GTP-binding protein [Hyphomicrobiaceae bacterium]|nr:GTP-binding protein [Hyphomicrobiaceae bacterium]
MLIQDDRVPVTLLTGFLGVGKTTLLNHVIRNPDAGRIAVVMNEFRDVGLDHDLIEEVTGDIVLMHAGCLCCSIRADLAKTMALLLSRRKRGELIFDRVIIETTGIADPGPIMNTMVTDTMIADNYRLDGVVGLADAATGPQTLDKQFEAVNQIAMADLIVVTKTDLVTLSECEEFETRLGGINSSAHRVKADHGRIPIDTLFGLSAMRPNATSDDITDWLGVNTHHAHDDHRHHRIESASIEVAEPIQLSVFEFWLESLLALKGPDILRMKGIVHIEGNEQPHVFHGVQHIFDLPVPLTSWSGKDTTSRAVLTARNMEKSELEASLEVLLGRMKSPEAGVEARRFEAAETSF